MFQRIVATAPRYALAPLRKSLPVRRVGKAPCVTHRPFSSQTSPLPDGWEEHKDPTDGTPYYYNTATQTTQWERPEAPRNPPSPVKPAAPASTSKLPWETDAPKDGSSAKLPWETDAPKSSAGKLPWETDAPKGKLPWETDEPKPAGGQVKMPWDTPAPQAGEAAKLPWETSGAAKLPWETDAPKAGGAAKLPWETDAPKADGAAKLPWETDAPKAGGAAKLPWETDGPKSLADQKLPWETEESTSAASSSSSAGAGFSFKSDGGAPNSRFGDRHDGEPVRSRLHDAMDPSAFSLHEINWAEEQLETTNKRFYTASEKVRSRTEENVREMLKKEGVTIKGSDPLPRPFETFEDAWDNHPDLMKVMAQKNFSSPTIIQKVGWSVALSGRDMIGLAQTGSGKTLGFAMPAMAYIQAQPPRKPRDGPLALIVCPTRELAQQIESDMHDFEESTGIKTLAVYGGNSKRRQIGELQRGVDIIVATPGRLMDLLSNGVTNLKRVGYLVLDEADRMLDMGFEPQIRKITSQIRPDRQTLMWSATWPREVEQLARDLCTGNSPVQVQVGTSELQANENIEQRVIVCAESEKQASFFDWCSKHVDENKKVIVFSSTKRECDNLSRRIESKTRLMARSIHGDKDQSERDQVLDEFRSGRCKVLVATDVAQRGLDISDIDYVVNYDCPKNIEDYIHRIGRTGRAGKSGISVTFMTSYRSVENRRLAKQISKVMRDVGQTPSDDLMDMC